MQNKINIDQNIWNIIHTGFVSAGSCSSWMAIGRSCCLSFQ